MVAYSPRRERYYRVNRRLTQLIFQPSAELTGLTRIHEETSTSGGISGKAPGMVRMVGCRDFVFGGVGLIDVGMDFRAWISGMASEFSCLDSAC